MPELFIILIILFNVGMLVTTIAAFLESESTIIYLTISVFLLGMVVLCPREPLNYDLHSGKKQCIELGYTDASATGSHVFCMKRGSFRTLGMAIQDQRITNKQLGKK